MQAELIEGEFKESEREAMHSYLAAFNLWLGKNRLVEHPWGPRSSRRRRDGLMQYQMLSMVIGEPLAVKKRGAK